MNFLIEPDPAHPLGGHALLILPDGASAGSGRLILRRLYDNRHLGGSGWQSAQTALGPFDVSHRGSGPVVSLGPRVVAHLEEFDSLEIAFEEGDTGSAIWPDNVLLPPGLAAAGGLHRAEFSGEDTGPGARISGAPAPEPPAETPAETPAEPPPEPPAEPARAPPPRSPSKTPRRLLMAGIAAAAVLLALFAATAVFDIGRLFDGKNAEEKTVEEKAAEEKAAEEKAGDACSEAAFAAGREAPPKSQIERVLRCGGTGGASGELRLATVEQIMGRSPEALVVMGRWYDPAHHEASASPFDAPAIETATRYYFEASQANATGAKALLRDACARLDPNDLMQDTARQLYCAQR